MNAQLAGLRDQFRSNANSAQNIVSRAGESRIAARPRPDSWSAAECLAHLTLSTEIFLPVWRAALSEARGRRVPESAPLFKMDLVGRMFKWALEPPPMLRAKAPAALHPTFAGDGLTAFLSSQTRLLELISDADGLALDRIRIASPIAARVRYNVWSSFLLTDAHQRRHLWQAERAAGLSE